MATTIDKLAHNFAEYGWKCYVDKANNRIISGFRDEENYEELFLVFQLSENGEYLRVFVPEIFKVKDHLFKGMLFQTILTIQWEVKMLRFEYNPYNGEINACIDLLLEDAEFTQQQFERVLTSFVYLVNQTAIPRLKSVLATGNDPGSKNLGEQILDAMPDEWVNLLTEAILSRQK